MNAYRTFLASAIPATILIGLVSSTLAEESLQVVVDIKAVSFDVAKNLRVEPSQIPLTVQAPLEVAAKVCDVAVTTLGAQGGSGAVGCMATKSSPALEKLVQEKLGQ
ncbi:hypothetical protein [Noviherbaspirillum sp. Root189]|uniref:hypothetical protein n=1 Tax=Noviherbaspirillum sp. Root189 TaxID=1736487 RepID=UPI0007104C60|nr:hypothetical protein [Noviherbaspirillum sp. Root189]KRB87403.1 hypothetical protein ASE07_20020 [Noviherbaspirillum sp. Root189]